MATLLGKRKRREAVAPVADKRQHSEDSEALEDAQEIFRRHFEAQFKPLPVAKKPIQVIEEPKDDSEEESDWDGISETEEDGVQVVEHTDAQIRMAAMSKEELKSFMSSKIPKVATSAGIPIIRDTSGVAIAEDDASEAANLKKDLALQRFLAESHLLDSSTSSSNPTLSGNNRHKATDLRLQALGSTVSILKQDRMPMSHRKGITAKKVEREDARRKEAKENGIILEKVGGGRGEDKRKVGKKRDRGAPGAPGVGKLVGGTLMLSKRDVFAIEGPKRTASGKGGRGGRGGGRGRGKRGRS